MNRFTYSASLMMMCCIAGKVSAQRVLGMPDSAEMRKEWLKTIERTTQDLGLTYNHKSMAAILVDRADAEARLKRYSKAIDDYNKAIFFDPALKQVYLRRAQVYEAMGSYKAAIIEYEKVLPGIKGDKNNEAFVWNLIAGNQFTLGNYEKAAKADSAAIMAAPQFSMAYANKGWANLHLGKYQQAADDFTEGMKGFQSSPEQLAAIYRNRGDAYRLMAKYAESIADYNSALKYLPEFADCYWGLATSYGMTGQYLLAENNFARSASLLKGKDDHDLARLYLDWAGMEEARHDYSKEIANDSLATIYDAKNLDAFGALAHAYALNGQLQQSIEHYNSLLKYCQGNKEAITDVYSAIAEQEFFLGHYDKVIEAGNAAIAVNPQAFGLYILRGRAYQKKSGNDLAAADFNKILNLDTNKNSTPYAFALFCTGKQEQAVAIMKTTAANAPNNLLRVARYYHLVRMYALMNKPDEANGYLKNCIDNGYSRKYASVDPDLENIRNTQGFKDAIADK
ncbi:MAG: tetratricopeptide repeat protein [Bacteroidetes bacterium]|nr:tetratricopeptide repeat protein [Bacteroidota bacterium]